MTGRETRLPGPAGGLAGSSPGHVPVLLDEVIHHLAPGPGGVVVDGTFGGGGYSRAILSTGATVLAIDRDPTAVAGGRALAAEAGGRLLLAEGRFSELDDIARRHGFDAVDGVVLDIGVSSMQVDEPGRGFSFQKDGPLDMRMEMAGPSAAEVVNTLEPRALTRLIAVLGEEKKAGLVSRAIAEARQKAPLTRTGELAALVERAIGRRPTDPIHPATRTFQALRIYVNRELGELADALAAAERLLRAGGRLVVVTFHSLEDRIVKRFLTERSRERAGGSRHRPEETVAAPTFRLLTRGAVGPSAAETARNPRARSAKLRAAERTAAPARPLDPADLGVPHFDVQRRAA